jgi:hypothetical protein
MVEQNIYFQELYKKLDNLCKDCYDSQEGVSEYIRQMDKCMFDGKRFVQDWEIEYNNLKHVRWVRNQLAHEVGTLNSNIVEEDDIFFVSNFYDKIMNSNDPLSLLRIINFERIRNSTTKTHITTSQNAHMQPSKKEEGFLSKLLSGIKNFFK